MTKKDRLNIPGWFDLIFAAFFAVAFSGVLVLAAWLFCAAIGYGPGWVDFFVLVAVVMFRDIRKNW